MSSGLTTTDTVISARNITPWHGLGVVLKRHPRSLEDELRKSGLGWTVRQEPLYRQDNKPVDGWQANLRSDTGEVLGVVTNRYTVIQNKEAFAFLANLLGGELAFETAGSLHGGKRVFVTCRLASIDHIDVGGDQVDLYCSFFNRHDGAGAVQLLTTPIRTVCRNTWDTAVGSAVNSFAIRHVGSPSARIAEARTALDLSIDYAKQFKRFGDRLAKQKIAERKVLQCAEELWRDNGTDRQIRNAQARREAVLKNSNRNEGGGGVVGECVGIRPLALGGADGCCAVGRFGRVVGAGRAAAAEGQAALALPGSAAVARPPGAAGDPVRVAHRDRVAAFAGRARVRVGVDVLPAAR